MRITKVVGKYTPYSTVNIKRG
uniref:Uncharacterized protein n=1 Tax=Anguilla anguilla TaxID=7936 RepID=A0A0E9PZJ5_ANGAN